MIKNTPPQIKVSNSLFAVQVSTISQYLKVTHETEDKSLKRKTGFDATSLKNKKIVAVKIQ